MPVLLATQKVEIKKIVLQGQSQAVIKIPYQPTHGHSGVCLSSQLCRRLISGRLQFQASLDKKSIRPPPSQQKNWMGWYMPVTAIMAGSLK
jgi:hypothetical protein